ncbi:MAG: hypothetical protein L0H93_14565 [Nocardioides sp.]|nr:hypothetical protein [Nocardioides sp.]
MTGPADLINVHSGDVFYWREQGRFGALFQRLTVTGVDTDSVHVVDEQGDPQVFDRRTAQVRWPDGLGRSFLEYPSAQVAAEYELFLLDEQLTHAARELGRLPASVTADRPTRIREVKQLEMAITAWTRAHAAGSYARKEQTA